MVKTLGAGRLPRVTGGGGLKVAVGTAVKGGTPGSIAVPIRTIRHATTRVLRSPTDANVGTYLVGTNVMVVPMGSTLAGYLVFNTIATANAAKKTAGTARAVSFSWEVVGE